MSLRAQLWPFGREEKGSEDSVHVTLYIVTGRHGIIRIPDSFCKECHLFYNVVEEAREKTDKAVSISVRSWWTGFPRAILHGGYHPPVLLVEGKKIAQGHNVPSSEEVVEALTDAANT